MSITSQAPTATPSRSRLVRRRSTAMDPLKKVTLRLHERVTVAVKAAVKAGAASSTDAFVEDAVIAALRERRRERLYRAYAEAAADPVFQAEMESTTRAFDVTLGDGSANDARTLAGAR